MKDNFPQRERYSGFILRIFRDPKYVGVVKAKSFTNNFPVFTPVSPSQIHIIGEDDDVVEGEDKLISEIRESFKKAEMKPKVAPTNTVFYDLMEVASRNVNLLESLNNDFTEDDEAIQSLRSLIEGSFSRMAPLLRGRSMKIKLDNLKKQYRKIKIG